VPLLIPGAQKKFQAKPLQFKTGSFGWSLAGKTLKVQIGDNNVISNISANLIVRGSKTKTKENNGIKEGKTERILTEQTELPDMMSIHNSNDNGKAELKLEVPIENTKQMSSGESQTQTVTPSQNFPDRSTSWNCNIQ